jgi:hypothetical protein
VPPDPEAVEPIARPGVPLTSGFLYGSAGKTEGASLSVEASDRIKEKIASVDEARLRGAEESHTTYVG